MKMKNKCIGIMVALIMNTGNVFAATSGEHSFEVPGVITNTMQPRYDIVVSVDNDIIWDTVNWCMVDPVAITIENNSTADLGVSLDDMFLSGDWEPDLIPFLAGGRSDYEWKRLSPKLTETQAAMQLNTGKSSGMTTTISSISKDSKKDVLLQYAKADSKPQEVSKPNKIYLGLVEKETEAEVPLEFKAGKHFKTSKSFKANVHLSGKLVWEPSVLNNKKGG